MIIVYTTKSSYYSKVGRECLGSWIFESGKGLSRTNIVIIYQEEERESAEGVKSRTKRILQNPF